MADHGSSSASGSSRVVCETIAAQANRSSLLFAGAALVAAALALLGARMYAFDVIVGASAAFLSTDGIVENANRRALAAALLLGAAVAVLVGALLLALAVPAWRAFIDALISWDPLRRLGLEVPNPNLVQTCSVMLGALIIGMHLLGSRLGGPIGPLFRREGLFELLTVALELCAVIWCVAAARHWHKHRKRTLQAVPLLYALLGVALFLVAMEELNWGQTLIAFDTPSSWAAINHQQETSLHNLLDDATLIMVERALAVLFGVGVLILIALAVKFPRSTFAAIAPPAALWALAALCAIPGAYLRLEVTELLLALFFAFYSYRIWVAARSRAVIST